MVAGTGSQGGKAAIPETFFQCRIIPYLGKKYKDHPVHYDSTLIFPDQTMAETYMAMFIKQLYEMDLLSEKQKYETAVVALATYLPQIG